jgi:hypothetical protein
LAATLEYWIFWDAHGNVKVERFDKHFAANENDDLPLRLSEP